MQLLPILAAAALAGAALQSGVQEGQNPPLLVSLRVEERVAQPEAVLEMQNVSGKPVAAYAVRLIRRGEDGKALSIRTHSVATRGVGLSLGRPSFLQGEKWKDTVALPEGQPVEVHLDLVLFEDGTLWGPNKARQLERFQGLRDGARLEREAAKRQP